MSEVTLLGAVAGASWSGTRTSSYTKCATLFEIPFRDAVDDLRRILWSPLVEKGGTIGSYEVDRKRAFPSSCRPEEGAPVGLSLLFAHRTQRIRDHAVSIITDAMKVSTLLSAC